MISYFENEYNVSVSYTEFVTNEELFAAIEAGGQCDVIFSSDYLISRMIREEIVEEINFSNIPNSKNLSSIYINPYYDPKGMYSVAYLAGTVGILYNKVLTKDSIDSWGALWDTRYRGKIVTYDSMRDSLFIALKYLGYSPNTQSESELNEAVELLISQKPLVAERLTDNVRDVMISGSMALAVMYSSDALFCKDSNPDLEYIIPKEGSIKYIDGMVIRKGSKNKDLAEKFINYMCRPSVAMHNTLATGGVPTIESAIPLLPDGFMDFEKIDSDKKCCEWLSDLGDFQESYKVAWKRFLESRV